MIVLKFSLPTPCCFMFMNTGKIKADYSRSVLTGNWSRLCSAVEHYCVICSLWLFSSNGCKFPPFHGRLMDKTVVKSNSMTASRANALNKSRLTVSTLTCNMWREDCNSSLVLELKLVMQHFLNISGLNHVAIHVTNQRQSGAPSDLSISSGFPLHCPRLRTFAPKHFLRTDFFKTLTAGRKW